MPCGARAEQGFGVFMLRIGEDFCDRPGLDDFAIFHHADLIRDLAHDAEVMGDEQKAHAFGFLEVREQIKDLRLNGHIQCCRRFIRDQDVGFVGQSHRDHHPLTLTTAQLVRIAFQPLFRVTNADLCQQVNDTNSRVIPHDALMQREGFTQLLLQSVQRVQRGHRLLEDKADVVAAHLLQQLFVGCDHLLTIIGHRSRNLGAFAQHGHSRQRGDGFTGPGLTHQRNRFAAIDREGHAFDRLKFLPILPEGHAQAFDL